MELAVQTEEEEVCYLIYFTEFHEIKLKLDEESNSAADAFAEKTKKEKLSPEEKENQKTLWIQKKAKLKSSKPIDQDTWNASIDALRKSIFDLTHEEAMKEAKKQTTLDNFQNNGSEE